MRFYIPAVYALNGLLIVTGLLSSPYFVEADTKGVYDMNNPKDLPALTDKEYIEFVETRFGEFEPIEDQNQT